MARHLDRGPVLKEAFVALMTWLRETWKTNPGYPGLSNKELAQKRNSVKEWLEQLERRPWPTDPLEYMVYQCEEGTQKHYTALSTQARKCLAIASRVLGFRYCARTMCDGLEFRLAWDESTESDIVPSVGADVKTGSIKRIEWLREPYQWAFSNLVAVGARAMADALGVDLRVRDRCVLDTGSGLSRKVVAELEQSGDVDEVRRNTAIVLDGIVLHDLASSEWNHLVPYRLVTVDVVGATVEQDHRSIASQLFQSTLDYLNEDNKRWVISLYSRQCFLLRHMDRLTTFGQLYRAAFADKHDSGMRAEIVPDIPGAFRHPHNLCERMLDENFADVFAGCDAVLAGRGDFAEVLMQLLYHIPFRRMPRIFASDLTPSLFDLMWEPESPLEAICGVDPVSYGQLVVRAACRRNPTEPIVVPAVLVTNKHVRLNNIRSYAELVASNPALQLHGEKYAWEPWMRPFSRASETGD